MGRGRERPARVPIELRPLARTVEVERGTPLRDVLAAYGVEFPCGGHGLCRGCRVKILGGDLPVTAPQEEAFSPAELREGWRLACRASVESPLTVQVAQWETVVLTDHASFRFVPRPGWGVAVDLGTTTLVAQLVDLTSGRVLGVRTALNPQGRYGADVMSRVQFAVVSGGHAELVRLIRREIGKLIHELVASAKLEDAPLSCVVIVGNTVMHHLLGGFDLAPLSRWPFETPAAGAHEFPASELGWRLCGDPGVRLLPCLGGFVGSDILAGVLATEMHENDALVGLVDLGTNGEIIIGNRDRMICASTAAGPAFEGGRISMGMQATTGAITEVTIEQGRLAYRVQGGGPPRGICGSGLVDAIAAALELGLIEPSGRLAKADSGLLVAPAVTLTQQDVRQVQLAKGATAAGIRILLRHWGADADELSHLYLAGAFGNYVNPASARRIGLIGFPDDKIRPSGNTALLGAKLALFGDDLDGSDFSGIRDRITHLSLAAHPQFQDIFVEEMAFPS